MLHMIINVRVPPPLLRAACMRAAASILAAACVFTRVFTRTAPPRGHALTTTHFINCSDVYEGLLMKKEKKGRPYGLESWRTTPPV